MQYLSLPTALVTPDHADVHKKVSDDYGLVRRRGGSLSTTRALFVSVVITRR